MEAEIKSIIFAA